MGKYDWYKKADWYKPNNDKVKDELLKANADYFKAQAKNSRWEAKWLGRIGWFAIIAGVIGLFLFVI